MRDPIDWIGYLLFTLVGASIIFIGYLCFQAYEFHRTHKCVRSHYEQGEMCIMHNFGTLESPIYITNCCPTQDFVCDEYVERNQND